MTNDEYPKVKSRDEYILMMRKSKQEFEQRYSEIVSSSAPPFDQLKEIAPIGRGAFGTVVNIQNIHIYVFYSHFDEIIKSICFQILYQHKDTQEYMVFKMLLKTSIVEKNQLKQTIHERKVLYAIRNPFMIEMLHTFKDNDAVYFVMPLMIGGDLNSYLHRYAKFMKCSPVAIAQQW